MRGDEILKLNHITKLYPGVTALDDLSMSFREGEIHAIVGENGAGKSTMIKVITGAIEPTMGSIQVSGKTFDFMTPNLSRENGVAVVYQEFTLVPVLTAAENIFMGEFIKKGLVLDQKEMERQTAKLFERLNVKLDPGTKVADMTTGYQQIVEIAKAISKDAKILIMDEPTAPLTMAEVEAMYRIVDSLKEEGITIIYISHRLDEIFRLSDRVTVLRDGKFIKTLDTASTNREELIRLMVGRDLNNTYPVRKNITSEKVLSVKNLSGNGVKDISFDLHRGEILGFGGLIGAGRTELAQLLFGSEKIDSGEVTMFGKELKIKNCGDAISKGIAMVPEDRKRHGLILPMTIKENITMACLERISKRSVLKPKAQEDVSIQYVNSLKIKTPSIEQKAKNLSGGNQQKVVLGKWLAMDSQIFIFDEPTRGIDVGAKQEIYQLMNDLADAGKSIIMISSDMEELLGMSDRVIVLCKGRMSGILSKEEISQESVLSFAAGGN